MPPKTTFGKDEVVRTAFEIVKEKGLDHLTARRVAEKLRSSTAPVYSCYHSMADLENAVLHKAKDLLLEYATRPYTDDIFLNMGVGIALFARDQGELYRALFMERGVLKDVIDDINASLRIQMDREEQMSLLADQKKDSVLYLLSVFTHGLASLVCFGLVNDVRQEAIIDILQEAEAAIIQSVRNNLKTI